MNNENSNNHEPLIELRGIWKTYRHADQPALQDIDLKIYPGQRVGLIGANGSGKTTLLRLLMNFVVPDRGAIVIRGTTNLEEARKFMGFVPEKQEGLENFTPGELLKLSAEMYGIPAEIAARRMEELISFARLAPVVDTLASDFSKGMIQRMQLSLALIHQPSILLLDEPMSGLDPGGQKEVREMLHRLSDITMIYASHQLEEVEEFCTSVVILHRGVIAGQIDLTEIPREVYTFDIHPEAVKLLSGISDIEYQIVREHSDVVRLQLVTTPDIFQKVVALLTEKRYQLQRLRSRSMLEELYYQYVQEPREEAEQSE